MSSGSRQQSLLFLIQDFGLNLDFGLSEITLVFYHDSNFSSYISHNNIASGIFFHILYLKRHKKSFDLLGCKKDFCHQEATFTGTSR